MTEDSYLAIIVQTNSFNDQSPEVKDLREKRQEIEDHIRSEFPSAEMKVREGGSMAKHTMVKDSYDGDIPMYVIDGDDTIGKTLEEIYKNIADALRKKYIVQEKGSALRILEFGTSAYTHIDVVPGRFVDDSNTDAYLFQNSVKKKRLKTNLDKHIAHIRDSGHRDVIKLMKIWKHRYSINIKTFSLELATIKALKNIDSNATLSQKVRYVLDRFENNIMSMAIEDPANPSGNDLSSIFNTAVKINLQSQAQLANQYLITFDPPNGAWAKIFGQPLESQSSFEKATMARPAQRPYWN